MSNKKVSPENVTELIDYLMQTKDPATVGLRKILKKKEETGKDFPLQCLTLEELQAKEGTKKIFDEKEKRIIELEKVNIQLTSKFETFKKKAAQAIQAAYAKGIQEGSARGQQSGFQSAQQEFDQKIQRIEDKLAGIFADIEKSQKVQLRDSQKFILNMAMNVAQKIIGTELTTNASVVLAVIKKALTYVADKQKLIIRVAPADLQEVTGKKDFWVSVTERLENVIVEADERIGPGGCIVESTAGVADARLNVQFDEIRELVERMWENVVVEEESAETPVFDLSNENGQVSDEVSAQEQEDDQ